MSRKDTRTRTRLLGIVANSHSAWNLNRKRESIKSYLISQQCKNVKAMITLYANEDPFKMINKGKESREPRRQFCNQKRAHARVIGRPTKYRQVPGANHRKKNKGSINLPCILCMLAAVAMSASNRRRAQVSKFNTDAKLIGVDNCASHCISYDKADFVLLLSCVQSRGNLKG